MKSERNAAVVMLGAAMIGLLLANSPFGGPFLGILNTKLNLDWINISITIGHIVSDLFLALFFFVAGLELKYELRLGALSSPKKAMVPVVAAIAGVVLPAAIYLFINWGQNTVSGWPIPTATDIAFALGILALFGRGMPKAARIFLLALAIFDDLVAISIIAIAYTKNLEPVWLVAAGALALAFRYAEKARSNHKWTIRILFGLAIWYTVFQSGVHATIAGVLMGVIIPAARSHKVMSAVQPATNFIVLPLFAFTAVAVVMPTLQGDSNPVFTGIFFGLAIGKAIGISIAAVIANRLLSKEDRLPLTIVDFVPLGFLAGIGFTVSLLMAHLAFLGQTELYAQATLGVLMGSFVAMGIGGASLWFRARWHIKQRKDHELNTRSQSEK
ncbi:MAG: Na+/H+ antiporter NhaA [Actinomycetota bacterium]